MSKKVRTSLILFGLAFFLSLPPILSAQKDKPELGRSVGNFTLPDPRTSQQVSLTDFRDKQAIVLLFLGTECPINNAYLPRLVELHKQYVDKGVQFVGINSNIQDSAERVAQHASKHALPFPVLKDEGNVVADQTGAMRTPEVIVLDKERKVRYQGRIDDRFGIGYQRPRPTRNDLALALDELLAGKAVSQPTTAVAGCLIGRVVKPKAQATVTYTKEVSRILQNRCQECHRPGQIAPMPLLTYGDARAWSATIREVVAERRMPPWFAEPRYGKFSNDRSLSREERETILRWVDEGCPKGDDKDLPPPRQFTEGWTIDKPDLVLSMKEEFEVPAVGPKEGVPYQYFTVETNFPEDRWVVQAQVKPGAPEVVHHILVYILPPGREFEVGASDIRVLCGVAPGDTALILQPGIAKRVPARSKLVFQMHYTPVGKATKDRSAIGMVFAKEPPQREAITVPVLNAFFRIPAGAANHRVESLFTFPDDCLLLGYLPHMHLRGKDFRYELIYPDGKRETLLWVPRFDFSWQNAYRLAEPLPVPKGSKLHCIAHFDNSANNPNNPDPTRDVRWGDQTWEEMMIGWTEFALDRKPK